jgi:hypothetical protein
MRRIIVVLAFAVFALLLAAPAHAGAWAVGTLDDASPVLAPGTPTAVGYTIRQHGRTPVDLEDTAIRMRSKITGETVAFPGRSAGAVGHYVADVVVPSAGSWTWELDMAQFGSQQLGMIAVADPGAPIAQPAGVSSPPPTASAGDGVPAWRRVGLPLLAAAAVGVFGAQLVATVRRRREPVPLAQ